MEAAFGRSRDGLIDALRRDRVEELDALHRSRRPERHLSLLIAWAAGWLRPMRRPLVEPIPEVTDFDLSVTFGGHATVLLRYAEQAIVCDPMLGGRVGAIKRAVRPGLDDQDLAACDLILISQPGAAHLHRPTLQKLNHGATVVVPPGAAASVSGLGFARIVELAIGQSVRYRTIDVTSTPVRRAHGGPSCAYVIRGHGPSVYYCSGSGYFSGFAEVGTRFRPDVALLPIGGYVPASFRGDNLSPLDALYAFEDLHARLFIPICHSSFVLSYEKLHEPVAWLRRLVAARDLEPYVSILGAGRSQRFVLPPEDVM